MGSPIAGNHRFGGVGGKGGTMGNRRFACVVVMLVAASVLVSPPGRGLAARDDAARDVDRTLDTPDLPTRAGLAGDRLGAIAPGLEVTARVIRSDLPDLAVRGKADPEAVVPPDIVTATAESLRALLASGEATSITIEAEYHEAVVSEGQAVVGASSWHSTGFGGAGVKIAVVDTGFAGYRSLLGTELPVAPAVLSFRADGVVEGSRHGTGVAEIIHDVAPHAELHLLATRYPSEMSRVVDHVIAAGVDVVSMSIGMPSGVHDGTSILAREVARATEAGVTWVVAAGNFGNSHWGGPFVDLDGDGWAELSYEYEMNTFVVPAGGEFDLDLSWTDRSTDLDICLFKYSGYTPYLMDCADVLQSPGDEPVEHISWRNASYYSEGVYGFAVGRYSGPATRFDVFLSGDGYDLDYVVPAGSLMSPAEVAGAVTVGAVGWATPGVVESYSSRGPTVDGRVKPDLVGPSRVSTVTYGPNGFPGTSSSAPHVAGTAALLAQRYPSLGGDAMKARLAALALPLGASPNNDAGWGLARTGPLVLTPPVAVPDAYEVGEREVLVVAAADGVLRNDVDADGDPLSAVLVTGPAYGQLALAPDGSFTYAHSVVGSGGDGFVYQVSDGRDVSPPVAVALGVRRTPDSIGLVDPTQGLWHLRTRTGLDTQFYYGNPGDYPIVGDWDCDGIDTPGMYRRTDGYVYLRNSNSQGTADIRFFFGDPGDMPLAGDFDGDGCDTVSIYRPGTAQVFVIDRLGVDDGGLGAAEVSYYFGNPGDKPVVGDFDGDGVATIGLHRESTGFVYFRQTHTEGVADGEFFFGDPGDRLVAGDWLATGIETVTVFRPADATFYMRHSNTQGVADAVLPWGSGGWLPVAGRFGF
jgi:subtilisin family serine protease